MVFPDDFLHFLKIKKKKCWIHQNYLVALILQVFFFFFGEVDFLQIVINVA